MSFKSRTVVLAAVLLLCGCSHKKPAQPQTQTTAATQESSLTGLPPSPYPRAALVSLPPPAPTSTPPAEHSISESNRPVPTETPAASSPEPASAPPVTPPAEPEATPTPTPAPSDGDIPRLTLRTTAPVIAPQPPPSSTNDNAQEQQVAVIDTSLGRIIIELDDFAAPRTCENFRKLISDGFYNHTVFHRVIPNFMIQGGDPNSKGDNRSSFGQGGPGYTLPAEIKLKHDRGAVAMARLPDSVNPQRESNGSQFYICVAPCPSLDDQYTVFGHVIKGMDVAVRIAAQQRDAKDDPLNRIEMTVNLEPKTKALEENAPVNP